MVNVLLVEDDRAIRSALTLALGAQGHDVRAAESGERGLHALQEQQPDVVVVDVMLPGIDGFEVCRRVRAAGETPVIMLTARGDDIDVVAGLEAGADDYVVKPVHPRVLDARIRAVLRRGAPTPGRLQRHGDLVIDRSALVVTRDGVELALTATELRLLLELSAVSGQVLSRQQLLQAVWEHDYLGDSRIVDAGVQRLRVKIEADPSAPRYIQTVRGFGYRFGPV